MKKLIGLVVGIMVPAFIMAGGMANSAVAQDKAKPATTKDMAKASAKGQITVKVLLENDKVKVKTETRIPAGAVAPSIARPNRVVHTVKGGTFMRTYPDGKKVKVETKTGETRSAGWRYLRVRKRRQGRDRAL